MTIIAITGTPVTGKTSVAKLLSEKLKFKYMDLNKLAEEKNLYSGFDQERQAKIVDTGRISIEIEKIEGDLILDSHYSQDIPNDITVVLRCKPDELRERMKKKGWKTKKIEENILSEIMEICKTEALEMERNIIEVDTAGKKPEEVVDEIEKKIRNNFPGLAERN